MYRLLSLLFALLVPQVARSRDRSMWAPTRMSGWIKPWADAVGHVHDAVEEWLGPRWADPEHARLAAGLFMSSVALACAGVVAAVSVSAPEPTVHLHLQRLASVVSRATLPAPVAELAATAVGPSSVGEADTKPSVPAVPAADAAPLPAAPPVEEAPRPVPIPPAARGALPIGKGMWIWMEDRADGGDPEAIVSRAKAVGLTHLYVRTGTLKAGFTGGPFLDRLLPIAHANGIRIYGWDFPYLDHPGSDVDRAMAAIRYTTPDGHRIDGFSADIESSREGTNNDIEYVNAYATWLRDNAGPDYPLIATVPNPTPIKVATGFPYATIIPKFDAVAPMVYWMNRDPGTDVTNAIAYLSQFGKPIFPVGQAYDGGPEGGPVGPPGRDATMRFLQFADAAGASGASFWSYQHATQEAWDALRDAAEFRLELGGSDGLTAGMIRSYQTVLTSLGFPVASDGAWGPATVDAVTKYQAAARLPKSGVIDEATRRFLLTPVAAPVARHG